MADSPRPRALGLLNPSAGGQRAVQRWRRWEAVLARMTSHLESFQSPSPGELRQVARARAAEFDWLLAVGGDGTVNEVLNGLLESGCREEELPRLGIVPLGSGNDIARNLGLLNDLQLEAALQSGAYGWTDALEARWVTEEGEGRIAALLTVGIGYGAEVLECTPRPVKRWLGAAAGYSLGAVIALWGRRPTEMEVQVGDRVWREPILFVACGNGEWEGGGAMRVSPGARMDDGLINVSVIREASRMRVLSKLPALLKGNHIREPEVDYLLAQEVRVHSTPPARLQIDGEVMGSTPVTVRVLPRAVPILGARLATSG